MSLLIQHSPEHCAEKGFHIEALLRRRKKRFVYFFSTFLSLILLLVFVSWLVLRPSKPEFYLKDTSIYELSLSPRQLINSSIQATLLSRNPNARVGVYYDSVRAYAVYRDQQITGESPLPPFYQGHEDARLLSASLFGAGVPVAPSVGYEVGRDVLVAGRVSLLLKLDGQLRWKVGSWVSGRYRFDVDCAAAVVGVQQPGGGDVLLRSVQGSRCSTSV